MMIKSTKYPKRTKLNQKVSLLLLLLLFLFIFPLFLFSCAHTPKQKSDIADLYPSSVSWIEAAMCKDIQEGTEGKPVDRTQVYTIQDKHAVMWIKMKDLKKRHNLRWKWYDPEGSLYYDTGDFPVGSDGSQYGSAVTWHKIGLFGEKASDLLGDWVVQVSMDDSPLVMKEFRVVGDLDPVILFISPATQVVHEPDLSLAARVEDEVGLQDVQIKINGEISKVICFQPGDKIVDIERKISMFEGETEIEIIASNGYRQITKKKNVVYARKKDLFSDLVPYKDSWALIVGIDDYEHIPKLNYAVKDSQEIKDILVKDMGFSEGHITCLINQEATRENILRWMGDQLPKKTSPEDRVLIFFGGHGYTRKYPGGGEMGYLMPFDAKASNVHSTAISMAEIQDIFKLIPAKHVLIIVDACYSGLVGMHMRGLGGIRDANESIDLEKLAKSKGRQVMTAGKADEEAIESDSWGHSLYTRYLIKGLKQIEADLNKDSIITTTELQSYLQPRVFKESEGRQTPQIRYLEGDGEFIFWAR
jgi:hypothetical protein